MPAKDPAAYMRGYRARKRRAARAEAATEVSAFDLAALTEPPADDPDVSTVTVRISDAQFPKLISLLRAIEARQGTPAKAPAAMRFALEVAHRALTTD